MSSILNFHTFLQNKGFSFEDEGWEGRQPELAEHLAGKLGVAAAVPR